jgi:hypothetical protein
MQLGQRPMSYGSPSGLPGTTSTGNPGGSLRLLLTSAGIKNTSIHDALVDLFGKPIAVHPLTRDAGRVTFKEGRDSWRGNSCDCC